MGIMLLVLLVLLVVIGSVMGIRAHFELLDMRKRLDEMRGQVNRLQLKLLHQDGQQHKTPEISPVREAATPLPHVDSAAAPTSTSSVAPQVVPPSPSVATPRSNIPKQPVLAVDSKFWQHLQQHWMVWLGGACVALAGIFLVRYSIEQDLLSPAARIVLGVLTGLLLHGAAGYLRRRHGAHMALAALAGGGSITLFAAFLSALHLYQLLPPGVVFVALALVALTSMWLALWHGPVLAILGILGAYLVPALVGGDGGQADIVLIYTLVISSSALLLLRYVERSWLWIGTLAGALLWWALTLYSPEVDAVRGLYLAALAYLLLALPFSDWRLRTLEPMPELTLDAKKWCAWQPLRLAASIVAILLAWCFSLAWEGDPAAPGLLNWLSLPLLLCYAAGRRHWLVLLCCVALPLQLLALLLGLDAGGPPLYYTFCIASVAAYSGMALWNYWRNLQSAFWLALALMAPLGFLGLTWLLRAADQDPLQWALLAALLGGVYLALALRTLRRATSVLTTAWLMIGGHAAYSLAVTMYFSELGLTLALALQIVSLAWIIQRFQLPQLGWLFKLVVMIIIARLSLNPWLFTLSTRVPWPLVTYGVATLCAWSGVRLLRQHVALQAWAGGAGLHLFVLTVWVLIRHALYDGNVFALRYDYAEAVLTMNLSAALALVYHHRAAFSAHLALLCRLYAAALTVLALTSYARIALSTLASEPWAWQHTGATPIFNLLLLAFGAPVLFAYLYARYYVVSLRPAALTFGAAAGFVFISLEIMHLWRDSVQLDSGMSDAELYTYSIVWLLLALAAMLGGAWRYGQTCYKAGMALLVLVIVKLFLVDMPDLTGLLRVASFMGMGLALLAIAYLHRRLHVQQVS